MDLCMALQPEDAQKGDCPDPRCADRPLLDGQRACGQPDDGQMTAEERSRGGLKPKLDTRQLQDPPADLCGQEAATACAPGCCRTGLPEDTRTQEANIEAMAAEIMAGVEAARVHVDVAFNNAVQAATDALAAGKLLVVVEPGQKFQLVPDEEPGEESILMEAERIINGPRAAYYGDARTNHQRIANLWWAYLISRPDNTIELAPHEVTYMMCLMKLARLIESPDHRDSHVDIGGYIGCAWKIVQADKADAAQIAWEMD